mmetsp:Transcript_15139/g.21128  ORF Transcript_15139/g.21128 Transcript_15139/m.21128 type:complete len:125 (+) Transcript_15139:3-377(+)
MSQTTKLLTLNNTLENYLNMPVHHVTSADEFNKYINGSGLVVVDFYADWCGPCKRISPVIEQYSTEFTNVTFIKVNVDELEDVASSQGISAMPSFFFFVGGKKVKEIIGANQQGVKDAIKELAK